jgi:hypothetical protein
MFNRRYISRLFYIHTELPMACFTGFMFLLEAVAYLASSDPLVEVVMGFGAVVMFILTSCFIYGIYRFETKYGRDI